jgi:hypothetical protein
MLRTPGFTAVAVLMIALGVSPFTAPFATRDLGTITGQRDQDHEQSRDIHSTRHAVLKWSAPDKSPILAEAAASTTPLFVDVPSEAGVHHQGVSIRPALRSILRI